MQKVLDPSFRICYSRVMVWGGAEPDAKRGWQFGIGVYPSSSPQVWGPRVCGRRFGGTLWGKLAVTVIVTTLFLTAAQIQMPNRFWKICRM